MGARWRTAVALGVGACAPGLPAEGRAARDALSAAMADRSQVDVARVSVLARDAARWKGQDAQLDVILGDAQANILMRPGEGLALLRTRSQPEDPVWRAAMGGAALRMGTAAAVYAVAREAGLPQVDGEAPGVAWLGARALRDPAVGWTALQALDADCALLDGQPSRGRRAVDVPLPPGLLAAARAAGADRLVLGRAERPTDDSPETGRGLAPCASGRLVGAELPASLPRHLVLGISGRGALFEEPLYLSLGWGPSREPWVLSSSRPQAATSLIEQALRAAPDPPPTGPAGGAP